jgi:hypothetical protein
MTDFPDRPPHRLPFETNHCRLCSRRLRSWRGPGPHFCTRCRSNRRAEVDALVEASRTAPEVS